jgi:DNA-binding LytR/AlgR family response regulator
LYSIRRRDRRALNAMEARLDPKYFFRTSRRQTQDFCEKMSL